MLRGPWIIVPGVLAALACAHGRRAEVKPVSSPVTVEVTNHYALPMEVHVVGAGISHRLGTVAPGILSQFVVPQVLIGGGSVELRAFPNAGGPMARSGPLLLAPGDVVEFEITARLFNSTATIW